MPITEEQRLERFNNIGSSDVPIIMGANPYRNITDLWLLKTGKVQIENKPTIAQRLGNHNEPELIKILSEDLNFEYEPDVEIKSTKYNFPLVVHLDALATINGKKIPIEAKTHGYTGHVTQQWGTALSDDIPDMVIYQCIAQMMAFNDEIPPYELVVAHISGREPQYHIIPPPDKYPTIFKNVIERCEEFYRCIVDDIQPKIYPTLEFAKLIHREAIKYPVNPEDIKALAAVRFQKKEINASLKLVEKEEDEVKTRILGQLKNGNASTCGKIQVKTIHYKEKIVNAYDVIKINIVGDPNE